MSFQESIPVQLFCVIWPRLLPLKFTCGKLHLQWDSLERWSLGKRLVPYFLSLLLL